MKTTIPQSLLLSLIKYDLISTKLVLGLNRLGLDADDYLTNLSVGIFRLMGHGEGTDTDPHTTATANSPSACNTSTYKTGKARSTISPPKSTPTSATTPNPKRIPMAYKKRTVERIEVRKGRMSSVQILLT